MAVSVITESMVVSVTATELAALVSIHPVDLIDVRDHDEWAAGHIDGARPLPLEVLRADPDAVLARGVALVFVCAKGIRSMQAAKLADRFGYDRVYTLEGGTKQWALAGRPLVAPVHAAAA
jgi:rhodanese-related sulfurtransferase